MALRQVVQYDGEGNAVLSKKSKDVKKFDENLWELLDDMWETMYENEGAGLAAVQVGVLKKAIVVEINEMRLELINAKITHQEGACVEAEGCLSVKGRTGYVERPTKITVEAFDRTGEPYSLTVVNYMARALCHEIDHTKGVLYIEKLTEKPEEK